MRTAGNIMENEINIRKILERVQENTKAEFIRIRTDISSTRLPLTASKIGGFPYWKDIGTYPVAENGLPLTLLAQINMSDLPENDVFPDNGLLQFFILNASDTKNCRVIFHKNIDMRWNPVDYIIPTSFMPEAVEVVSDKGELAVIDNVFWGKDGFPVSGELKLEFYKEYESVNPSENCFVPEYVKAMRQLGISLPDDYNIYDFPDEIYEQLFLTSGCHKLLGHPFFIQGDYREDEDEILLFQIDPFGSHDIDSGVTDENNFIAFGDSGNAGFFIKKRDLKKLDFSKVVYTWSCL